MSLPPGQGPDGGVEAGGGKAIGGAKKADIRIDGIDGIDGIDNSFGKNLVNGIIATLAPGPSDIVTESISKGDHTLLLAVDALGGDPSYTGLVASLLPAQGAPAPAGGFIAPTQAAWEAGTYSWHPLPSYLAQQSPPVAASPVAQSYMTDNVLVLGPASSLTVTMNVAGFPLELVLLRPVVSARYSPDRAWVSDGNIGGILATEALIISLKGAAGHISTSLCDEAAFEGIAGQIRGASDILHDGKQDPKKACDSISIGIGFEGNGAQMGAGAPEPLPQPDPCVEGVADAGAD